ncbi:MAG: hypothetical protein N2Z74_02220, partial [Syntrophales bacterium]|nr:hypothetical protein [Syntrophales bacterium]
IIATPALARDLEEATLYAKADALCRQGRYLDAVGIYMTMQRRFPDGKYAAAVVRDLKRATVQAVNESYRAGDYLAAAAAYYRTLAQRVIGPQDTETLMKVADSLRRMFLLTESRRIYAYAKIACIDRRLLAEINAALDSLKDSQSGSPAGDVNLGKGEEGMPPSTLAQYAAALEKASPERRRWLLYEMGGLLLKEGKKEEARRTFLLIKEGDGDPFWTKVSDYALTVSRGEEKAADGQDNVPARR